MKSDINNYPQKIKEKFTTNINSLLINLLESKESECRTGGLNILGSLCGLGYNFDSHLDKIIENLNMFRRCEYLIC